MKTTYERRWLILAVILAAECMDLLDSTIVNVAAPKIHHDLHTSSTGLQWIVGGYALAISVGLMTGGRLGDIFGRRQMFLVGAAGFTISSVLCGLAPNTGSLITFRLLQGVLGALMLPQGFGVLREVFPPDEVTQAFAIFGPVIGSAAVFGPVIGGGLVDLNLAGSGWRLVFFVNAPLGIAAIIGAWRLLPKTKPAKQERLDLLGAFLSTAASLCLVYPLIEGRELGWPAWTYLMMAGSVVLYAVFGLQQRARSRANADPLLVPSMFGHRGYTAGLLVLLVFFSGMGGLLLTASVFFQLGEGFSPVHAGLCFMPMSAGMAVGAGLSGAILGPKFGRLVIQAGGVVTIVGWLLVIGQVHGGGTVGGIDLIPGLALAGLGMGLVVAPLFDVVLASVTDAETGSASGLLNASQQLAGAIGVAVLGTIFFSALGHVDFHAAFDRTLWVEIGSLVVMVMLSGLLPRYAREPAADVAAPATAEPASV
ncbi:MAG TPA: MFS transporter [Mycobacteriales bacterium]|nr:MFS transporter [Mycobacteriales bacterium]